MKTNTLFLTLLVSSAITACGGGSDNPATSSSATSSTLGSTTVGTTGATAPVTANYNVYSAAGSIEPSFASSTSTNGNTTISVGNQTATVTATDTDGNATAINGSFTKVVSFGGNLIGQLCGNSTDGTNGFKSQYSFVNATVTAASLSEMTGKSFDYYEDCVVKQTVTFNGDGSATFSAEGTAPATELAQAFGPTGHLYMEGAVQYVTKAFAFKTTIGGVARYGVIVLDRPNNSSQTNGDTALMVQR